MRHLDPTFVSTRKNTDNQYWSLWVRGRQVMHDESFAVVDAVRDALVTGRGMGELGEVAAAILAAEEAWTA
jgi:hypothetical protein